MWARAARDLLGETARQYGAVVTDTALAAGVQSRTSIRTKAPLGDWIPDVLTTTAVDASRRGDPVISALCVDEGGSAGERYRSAVAARGETAGDNPEWHAAEQRLECYRRYGATLPADGGRPTLIRKAEKSASPPRKRQPRRTVVEAPPRATCPTCFMELPMTGICDTCG
ncbi:UNVERIFIED_CONTAM: hypothetical protein LK11_32935 [Mumia flava]